MQMWTAVTLDYCKAVVCGININLNAEGSRQTHWAQLWTADHCLDNMGGTIEIQSQFFQQPHQLNNVRLFIGLWGLFNPSVMDNLIEQSDSPQLQGHWRLTAPRVSLSCEKENMKMHEVLIHNLICRHGCLEWLNSSSVALFYSILYWNQAC